MQPHSTSQPYFPENLDDYAPWVAIHGLLAPYGKCQCGCGEDAPICKSTDKRRGYSLGQPKRFLYGHYRKWATAEEYFFAHVDKRSDDECWLWKGDIGSWGYGGLSHRFGRQAAHRFAWELYNHQAIPEGMLACHKCDNPPCVNPNHIFLGTQMDNFNDRRLKGRNRLMGKSKLTLNDVGIIRNKWKKTLRELAVLFKVSEDTIESVIINKTWRDVK